MSLVRRLAFECPVKHISDVFYILLMHYQVNYISIHTIGLYLK